VLEAAVRAIQQLDAVASNPHVSLFCAFSCCYGPAALGLNT
jgi:hypothetical protein